MLCGIVSPNFSDLPRGVEFVPFGAANVLANLRLKMSPFNRNFVSIAHQAINRPLRAFLCHKLDPQVGQRLLPAIGSADLWWKVMNHVVGQNQVELVAAGLVARFKIRLENLFRFSGVCPPSIRRSSVAPFQTREWAETPNHAVYLIPVTTTPWI